MKVNVVHQLFAYRHSSKYHLLCSAEEKTTTSGWVNWLNFHFWGKYPFKVALASISTYYAYATLYWKAKRQRCWEIWKWERNDETRKRCYGSWLKVGCEGLCSLFYCVTYLRNTNVTPNSKRLFKGSLRWLT